MVENGSAVTSEACDPPAQDQQVQLVDGIININVNGESNNATNSTGQNDATGLLVVVDFSRAFGAVVYPPQLEIA